MKPRFLIRLISGGRFCAALVQTPQRRRARIFLQFQSGESRDFVFQRKNIVCRAVELFRPEQQPSPTLTACTVTRRQSPACFILPSITTATPRARPASRTSVSDAANGITEAVGRTSKPVRFDKLTIKASTSPAPKYCSAAEFISLNGKTATVVNSGATIAPTLVCSMAGGAIVKLVPRGSSTASRRHSASATTFPDCGLRFADFVLDFRLTVCWASFFYRPEFRNPKSAFRNRFDCLPVPAFRFAGFPAEICNRVRERSQ